MLSMHNNKIKMIYDNTLNLIYIENISEHEIYLIEIYGLNQSLTSAIYESLKDLDVRKQRARNITRNFKSEIDNMTSSVFEVYT